MYRGAKQQKGYYISFRKRKEKARSRPNTNQNLKSIYKKTDAAVDILRRKGRTAETTQEGKYTTHRRKKVAQNAANENQEAEERDSNGNSRRADGELDSWERFGGSLDFSYLSFILSFIS